MKQKKYSITVGKKPDPNKTAASQDSQQSMGDEENMGSQEDNLTEKECSKDYVFAVCFMFKNL